MVIQSPERNWNRIHASHPDHMAAGEAAIQAVYPDARNPFAWPELLSEEGLAPWTVRDVWIGASNNAEHWVDITDTFPRKIEALRRHVSQTSHVEALEERVLSGVPSVLKLAAVQMVDLWSPTRSSRRTNHSQVTEGL